MPIHFERKWVYNILTADTALRALERLDTRPDLAVLDVMLPDMDGFMLAKVIREQTNIPILFLTAKGEFDDKAKGFEVGADDYIVKPFLAQEFVWRVTAILRRVYKEMRIQVFIRSLQSGLRTGTGIQRRLRSSLPYRKRSGDTSKTIQQCRTHCNARFFMPDSLRRHICRDMKKH